MKLRKMTAALMALIMTVFLLPRLEIPAEAAVVKFLGYTISSGTEKLCLYTDSLGLGEYLADMDVQGYTDGDFDKYYTVPAGTEPDIAEIAEKFPKLKKLAIIYGRPKNTGAFAKMKNLTGLQLYHAGETDLSFLKDIGGNLKKFRYSGDVDGGDLSPLKYLKNVTELSLDVSAQVTDPTAVIKKLTKLKKLSIACGRIKNADFVSGLKNLTSLKFNECANLSDIKGLSGLKKLRELEISTRVNEIDLSPLRKLKKLEKLTLGQGGKDIGVISGLANLKDLYLHNYVYNKNVTVSGIKKAVAKLTGLEFLSFLDCGQFGDLDFLSKHKNLKSLYFFDGAVSGLSGIKKLTKLESLSIMYNNFHFSGKLDISPLKNMTEMKELNLNNSPLKDVSVLKDMKKLEWLGLSGTTVEDMSPIMGLDKLKRLVAYECYDSITLEKFREKYPDCSVVPGNEDMYY